MSSYLLSLFQSTYTTGRLLRQMSMVRPAGFRAAFWQGVVLCRIFFLVIGRLSFKIFRRTYRYSKERMLELGAVK